MRRSKAVSAVALFAGAALVLSACGGGGSEDSTGSTADVKSMATGKAQSGDNYKLGDAPEFEKVTVAIDEGYSAYNNKTPDANSSYNNYVLTAVIASPFVLDGNNKVLLNTDVMESVTVTSKDPQIVQWKMKPGVKWSDGGEWDCDDFYLGWLSHSGKAEGFESASTTGYDLVQQGECKDPLTFEAKFDKPYLDYKGMFTDQMLMPAHILEAKTGIADIIALKPGGDAAAMKKASEFWMKEWKGFKPDIMPGSGPYMITAFDQNSKTVTLSKNPNWIGAKGGPKTVIVRAIVDPKAMATALQNGEIDVAASTQPDETAATTMKNLANQGVTYGSAPQLTFEHLDLQYNRMFKDPIMRKAFFEAVNRQEIVDKLLKGVQSDAQVLNSIQFFQGEPGYQDLYSTKAGLGAEAAAKTLSDAGWVKGADGIFAKNGQRFSVTITHNDNPRRRQTVELIIPMAKAAGIEVKDETDANFLKGRVDKGEYDIALFAWSQQPFKAESRAIYTTGGGQNWQGLSNPTIDTTFNTAVSATDEAAATKAYQEVDAALANEYATLPIYSLPSMWGFRGIDRVYMQSYNGALWNVGEWKKTD
ncbi:ABC transporter family substrate-binding protein [Amycolatopsis suaedae]|uniref:ABC transporter family substrate-binding protein n=1 Tax=Amycolatopsis suaedae TaxID=2510978 RepID=A0A4Q7J8Q1_9PSEU|nr:ABC transporter family substrate-binding protein [Amycolatopsis suaedae]RZQ63589.1 ABC transporter family substrate-binding protein [Amycolatopsis suaedae]